MKKVRIVIMLEIEDDSYEVSEESFQEDFALQFTRDISKSSNFEWTLEEVEPQ